MRTFFCSCIVVCVALSYTLSSRSLSCGSTTQEGKEARPQQEQRSGYLRDIVLSENQEFLATADNKSEIWLWNPKSLEKTKVLKSTQDVRAIAISPDNKILAAITDGMKGANVHLWSIEHVQILHKLDITDEKQRSVSSIDCSIAFSPCGKFLAVISENHTGTHEMITVWTIDNRKLFWQTMFPSKANGRSLCFDPKGKWLITCVAGDLGSTDVRAWDWKEKKLKRKFTGFEGGAYCVACSPNGKTLACGGAKGGAPKKTPETQLWNLDTGKNIGRFDPRGLAVMTLAWSPDGKYIAFGMLSGDVSIWESSDMKLVKSWKAYGNYSVSRILFPSNHKIITLGGDESGSNSMLRLWEVNSKL